MHVAIAHLVNGLSLAFDFLVFNFFLLVKLVGVILKARVDVLHALHQHQKLNVFSLYQLLRHLQTATSPNIEAWNQSTMAA